MKRFWIIIQLLFAVTRLYAMVTTTSAGGPSTLSIKKNDTIAVVFDQPLFTLHEQLPGGFEIGYLDDAGKIHFEPAGGSIHGHTIAIWKRG